MPAPRVLVSIEPRLYAEALAASLRERRPRAEVTLLDPSGDLPAWVGRVRPHLVVANRVPPEAKGGASSWVEVAVPSWGVGPRGLAAEIGAGGRSESVANLGTEEVLAALDRAHGANGDAAP